jgi:K+-transporting ATPase ATPase C chain
MRNSLVALRVTLFTLVVTGLAWPLAMTGLSLALFPSRAHGTLATDERDAIVGSELIGQAFVQPAYLWPRPSAVNFDAAGSGASNLGPTSKALRDRAAAEAARLVHENPRATTPPPAELVTTSASGLDPHVSPEAAFWQAPRIAQARRVEEARVRAVIEAHVEGRDLFVLGEPRVNVLLVNLALDRHFGKPPSGLQGAR